MGLHEYVFPTTAELVAFAVADIRFARSRGDWAVACERDISEDISSRLGDTDPGINHSRVAVRPDIRKVRLASGELLSAATDFVDALLERGCIAADMEAGGAAIVCDRSKGDPRPQLMILRGISDSGDEGKGDIERQIERNFFRRACMRNASRLLLCLIDHPDFAAIIQPGPRSTETVMNGTAPE